MLFLLFYNW